MVLMKRFFDFLIALLAIILLAVPILILALCVHYRLGSPVFFRQTRPGIRGKPFEIVKFRSMRDLRGSDGELLPDNQRLTVFGSFMRSSSLDELPELWNVLRGDMSLVGPRALLMEYLPLYSPEQSRRHEVRPGITGWAQINGRNLLDWDERFKFDVWYVDNQSILLDIKILLITIKKVLAQEGINAKGDVTMPKFKG